jgi:ABC-type Fe3+-hydroxamate transport system substrate-binding protein
MNRFTDQLGREIVLPAVPKRIVSLVPSQTELLYDLGLETEVVGITKFCIHPQSWFRSKARIGGTKTVSISKLAALTPDLILANKEENTQEQVEALAKDFPVWISDISDLPGALEMIRSVGIVTGKQEKAIIIATQIESSFSGLQLEPFPRLRTGYLIWKKPYMTVGGDTFINDILQQGGFENVFGTMSRYPQITVSDLQQANCQLLFLSSEPYPFKQTDIEELQADLPYTRIVLVDGEIFSWYGSRLLHTPAYLQTLQLQIETMP